jgi:hypothetical protein
LLLIGLLEARIGLFLALALCGWQIVYYALRRSSFSSFPVQVHLAYLGLLVAGLWEPLRYVHWVQPIGITAFVTFGY